MDSISLDEAQRDFDTVIDRVVAYRVPVATMREDGERGGDGCGGGMGGSKKYTLRI